MIDRFRGKYSFLSNFYPAEVEIQGQGRFPTTEHAYQFLKVHRPRESERAYIMGLDPVGVKRWARTVEARADWDQIKDAVMLRVVYAKFTQHQNLRDKLCATGTEDLVEGNHWGDTYWGVCEGVGENKLGKILMQVRGELCR
jgi:ribA/ribD-fused uncharacterized protein